MRKARGEDMVLLVNSQGSRGRPGLTETCEGRVIQEGHMIDSSSSDCMFTAGRLLLRFLSILKNLFAWISVLLLAIFLIKNVCCLFNGTELVACSMMM